METMQTDGVESAPPKSGVAEAGRIDGSDETPWRDLYDEVMKRWKHLTRLNNWHVKVYKWMGYCLSVTMPLLAAAVTYLSTVHDTTALFWASIVGLALTILTVLNSVFAPGERFLSAVHLSHALTEFELDIEMDQRKLSATGRGRTDHIFGLLHARNRELSTIGEAMATGTLSTKPVNRERQPGS